MSNRDRAAEVLHAHEKDDPWNDAGCNDDADGAYTSCHDRYLEYADALIAAGLIHVGQGFCTKASNCRLADGHAAGCERT